MGRVVHNIVALGSLQAANYGLLLVTLPYLTHVFGPFSWGRIVFVQMVLNYFIWLTNWGFYLGTARDVAASRNDPAQLRRIHGETWFGQVLLTGVGLMVLLVMLCAIPRLHDDLSLYFGGMGLVLANLLMPFWLLNGLERMREAALIQIGAKLGALPCFFFFVKNEADGWKYFAINSGWGVIFGVATVCLLRRSVGVDHSFPGWTPVLVRLRENGSLFVSTLWANLYGSIVPVCLGLFSSPTELGYYNIADRVRGAAITVLQPITHALFPRMCHLYATDLAAARRLLVWSSWLVGGLASIASLGILLGAEHIPRWIGGSAFLSASGPMRWMAFTPFLTTASAFLVHQVLIPARQAQLYQRAMLATMVMTAALAVPLIQGDGAVGAARVILIAEFVLLAGLATVAIRRRFYLKSIVVP